MFEGKRLAERVWLIGEVEIGDCGSKITLGAETDNVQIGKLCEERCLDEVAAGVYIVVSAELAWYSCLLKGMPIDLEIINVESI